jgi:hypothetical protein
VNPQQPHAPAAPAVPQLSARLLWAEGGWRCFLLPSHVRLYSGGKRLLSHPVQGGAEGEEIGELWLRSIRRIGDLANAEAQVELR